MSVTNTPIFPQSLVSTGCAIGHGIGTMAFAGTATATGTVSVAFVPGTNGAMLTAVNVNCTDTATCTMVLAITTGTGSAIQILGAAVISGASMGTMAAIPPTNLLNGTQGVSNLPYDSCGNKILYVQAGSTLVVGLLNTIINGSGFLYVNCVGGNF